jgi:RNA polymerase subunit RPABC4/transcription elongation factor Spt4
MRYTSYLLWSGLTALIVWVLLAAFFVGAIGPAGFLLALVFGLVVSLLWARRAIVEFGSAPFSGVWGMMRFRVLPDDPSAFPPPPPPGVTAAPGQPSPTPWSETPMAGSAGSSGAVALVDIRACSRCGTITTGADSKYCRSCRASLEGAEMIEVLPELTCRKCGAVTRGRVSRFCRSCGAPIA